MPRFVTLKVKELREKLAGNESEAAKRLLEQTKGLAKRHEVSIEQPHWDAIVNPPRPAAPAEPAGQD